MIDLQKISPKNRQETVDNICRECQEISGFWDIDGLHAVIHQFKTDHPDKKGFAKFNEKYFFTDDEHLTIDDLYLAITGETRLQRQYKLHNSFIESQKRETIERACCCKKISSFIWQGLSVLAPEHHEEWIILVPLRVMDMYHGFELESFLALHNELELSTFEKAKDIFELQGHSGMSASIVFQMLEKFTPNGKDFVKFLKG